MHDRVFQSCLWSKQRVRACIFFPGDLQSDAIAKSAQQNALRIFQFFLKIRLKSPLQLHVIALLTPQIFAYHLHFVSCNFPLSPSMPKEKGVIAIIKASSLLNAPKPSPPKPSISQIHRFTILNLPI
jgi:hypothetical protein